MMEIKFFYINYESNMYFIIRKKQLKFNLLIPILYSENFCMITLNITEGIGPIDCPFSNKDDYDDFYY